MTFDPSILALLFGISTLANAIVEALIKPIWERYNLDNFWLLYIAWIVAGVLTFLGNINLFEAVFEPAIVGLILSAVIAGRASNILHDLTDQGATFLGVDDYTDDSVG